MGLSQVDPVRLGVTTVEVEADVAVTASADVVDLTLARFEQHVLIFDASGAELTTREEILFTQSIDLCVDLFPRHRDKVGDGERGSAL